MKDIGSVVQAAWTALGGCVGAFLGGFDGFVYALVVMMLLDYALGVVIAVLRRRLSSAVGFKGIAKKGMILAFVGVGALIDTHIIQGGALVRTAVIFFYFANEGISIVENAAVLGLPVPRKLRDILAQLRDDGDKGEISTDTKEGGGHEGD